MCNFEALVMLFSCEIWAIS